MTRKKRCKAEFQSDCGNTASETTLTSDCQSDSESGSEHTVRSSTSAGANREAVVLRKKNKKLMKNLEEALENNCRQEDRIKKLTAVIVSLEATITHTFGATKPPTPHADQTKRREGRNRPHGAGASCPTNWVPVRGFPTLNEAKKLHPDSAAKQTSPEHHQPRQATDSQPNK